MRGYSATKKELKIDGIKHTIAIASGKGGVGKSTTAGTFFCSVACFLILGFWYGDHFSNCNLR